MKRFMLIVCILLLAAGNANAGIQFFPASAPTGGTTALDGIDGNGDAGPPSYDALEDGDVGWVATTGLDVCIYVLDADASCGGDSSESPCPQYVQPDSNPGTKCWVLSKVIATSFSATASSTPGMSYYDKEATAGDINCRTYANCTGVVDANEYCDWTLECQVAGSMVNKIVCDADGYCTVTGLAATNAVLTTPNIGTPSACALTNCTGLPLSSVVDSTSEALGVGTLEIGHASDTTIARSGAGDITVEGNQIYRAGGTDVPDADVADDLTISGGTVNNTVIGGSTPAAISGTTGTFTGTLAGNIGIVEDADGNAAMTAAECRGSIIYNNTQANAYVLPAAAAGLNVCFYEDSAHALTVRPEQASSDQIVYEGTSCGVDDDLVGPGTAGSFVCMVAKDSTYWTALGHANTWTCE